MYLRDPHSLAEYVKSLLLKDDFEKAAALTKLGSRAKSVIVAWNHLIDSDIYAGRVTRAFATYNDVSEAKGDVSITD